MPLTAPQTTLCQFVDLSSYRDRPLNGGRTAFELTEGLVSRAITRAGDLFEVRVVFFDEGHDGVTSLC